jgi:uncharacterized alpha-E superfamily protein
MLSRVANTIYWMARYVERADNLARLIDVNQQLLLDTERLDSARLAGFWRPIILSTGDDSLFQELYGNEGSDEVIRFLTDDPRNPNSITSCASMARENARTIRDQLADELWEEINALYLFIHSPAGHSLRITDPPRFYSEVRRTAAAFFGLAATSIPRNEATCFLEIGRYLERADKATRFIDVLNFLPEHVERSLHLAAILRSCGALGAFRSLRRGRINEREVVDFLVLSPELPRSVRFCIDRTDSALHKISGTPRGTFGDKAERESGKLLFDLSFHVVDDIFDHGLHEYLDSIQVRLNAIGDEIFDSYVLMPDILTSGTSRNVASISAAAIWEMQQQQQ